MAQGSKEFRDTTQGQKGFKLQTPKAETLKPYDSKP